MTVAARVASVVRSSRWFASQLAVSIAATLCVAAFFPSAKVPGGSEPVVTQPVLDGSKSAQRVANGGVDQTVLRFDSQQQAALASLANFTPHAAPDPVVQVAQTPASRPVPKPSVALLPPRRPTLAAVAGKDAAPPAKTAAAAAPSGDEDWRVGGVGIPGSATLRRYVPSGSEIAATSAGAWNATTAATKTVAQKVVGLSGLLGL